MARLVRISPSRLQHIFKEQTGWSINRYLRELRLKKAAALLTESFLSVKEIRCTVGITDTRHFASDFKRRYGMTPSSYRNEHFNPASTAAVCAAAVGEDQTKSAETAIK
ncbi:MAG: helix-turn-helix transcriptional regulator [Acidobacteriota bacterium]|nr:helix-turn-helix transcriptional regulator [Acidobacteriota bacterium]